MRIVSGLLGVGLAACDGRGSATLRREVWDSEPREAVALDTAYDVAAEDGGGDGAGEDSAADAIDGSLTTPVPSPPPSPWGSWMLPLDLATHGVDGVATTFLATGSQRIAVRLRPAGGTESVIVLDDSTDTPTMRSVRFGDAPTASLLVHGGHPVGWNFFGQHYSVVSLESGKVVRAVARHAHSKALRDVKVWDLATGVGPLHRAFVRESAAGGHELVEVRCGAWWPDVKKMPATCPSTNLVYYRRGGSWWWAEGHGDDCIPRPSGWCVVPSTAPSAAAFPPATTAPPPLTE